MHKVIYITGNNQPRLMMKNLTALLVCIVLATCTFAQSPQQFNYQGVARDAGGNILANQAISVQFSLHDASPTGTVEYQETHALTTNQFGLFNTAVGSGTVVSGTFSAIDWGSASKYLQVELDPAGGSSYVDMGTSQLLSVPYALYAENGGGTLDDAYDYPSLGAGRLIDASNGALRVDGDDGLLVTGTFGSGDNIEVSGTGTRMFFNPKKAAFRAGQAAEDSWNNSNVGNFSFAAGENSIASGRGSVAFGGEYEENIVSFPSVASGSYSFAAGVDNESSGFNSYTFGRRNEATEVTSFAFGFDNESQGENSFTLGRELKAFTIGEFVIGQLNTLYTPSGSSSFWSGTDRLFVIGNGNSGRSNAMVVLKNGNTGIGVDAPTANLELNGQVKINGGAPGSGKVLTSDADGLATWESASSNTLDAAYDEGGSGAGRQIDASDGAVRINGDDGLIVTGTFGSGDNIEVSGTGTRMFFNPKKAAFRAGFARDDNWDNANVGNYSFATGENSIASGYGAVALGGRYDPSLQISLPSDASGDYSISVGTDNEAGGSESVAIGLGNQAIADRSYCFGYHNETSGYNGVAVGVSNNVYGSESFAFGRELITRSFGEVAVGSNNTDYTPSSSTVWSGSDRLFVIGNGPHSGQKRNAMVVLKNGKTGIGTSSPSTTLDVEGTTKLGANGSILTNIIKATVNYDMGGVSGNTTKYATLTVANAAVGSTVHVSPADQLPLGLAIGAARVSAANTVEIVYINTSGSSINPPAMDYFITVIE